MFGRLLGISFFSLILVIGCSKKEEEHRESTYEERVVLAIDAGEYGHAISIIEKEMPIQMRMTPKFQTLLANAHLGAGGMDLIQLVRKVRAPMKNLNNEQDIMASNCHRGAVGDGQSLETRCWMIRLMTTLPNPTNKHLKKAEEIYDGQIREQIRISSNNQILIAILKTSEVFKRLSKVLEFYISTGDTISVEQSQDIFDEILVITALYKPWFDSLEVLPEQLHKKLTGDASADLLTNHADKLEFVENTGIPFLENKLPEDNQSLTAKLTRGLIVQAIDSFLRDFFKVPLPDEE